jgi:AAA domain, putative AbiEii toxin, Type IV TA system
MSRDASSLENIPFRRAEVKIYSKDFENTFTHVFEKPPKDYETDDKVPMSVLMSKNIVAQSWYQLRTGEVDQISIPWNIKPALPKPGGQWSHGWLPTSRLYIGALRNWRLSQQFQYSEQALDNLFQEALTNLWHTYSAKLLSEVRKVQESGLANILQAVLGPQNKVGPERRLDAATARERVITFLNRQGAGGKLGSLKDFEKRYANDPRIISVAEHIDKVESAIEVATAPRAKLQELIQRMFSGPKKLSFTDTAISVLSEDGRDIGLRSLSSGEKHVLRIFAEAINLRSDSLLIDEPEISLHIDWQRALIKSLITLNPDCQLILATHSPEIMAEIDDKYIYQL